MATPRGFEPPANSLGNYYTSIKINSILLMCHIFATWISNKHARLLLAMTQSRALVFEYANSRVRSKVEAIIQNAMRRLCAVSGHSRPRPGAGKFDPERSFDAHLIGRWRTIPEISWLSLK